MRALSVLAPDGIGEIEPGTDLAELVATHCELVDGDIVLVTSKAVSKAERRVLPDTDRAALMASESTRVLARRGQTTIVANRVGMVQAAAGIDASNVATGSVVLLPEDPDGSARRLREALATRGVNVAVVITDTFGRAWRTGQTDAALGVAGLEPLQDYAGRSDGFGNPLVVTAMALADELAAAADLVKGKLGGRPLAVVRGRADLVLAPGAHGPGGGALVRPLAQDMFALGTREAVLAAVRGELPEAFGSAAPAADLVAVLTGLDCTVHPGGPSDEEELLAEGDPGRVRLLAHAYGWTTEPAGAGAVRLRPRPPGP